MEKDLLKQKRIVQGALDRIKPELSQDNHQAVAIWNTMNGIDWTALPLLVELYDVRDPEELIEKLTTIRNELNKPDGN